MNVYLRALGVVLPALAGLLVASFQPAGRTSGGEAVMVLLAAFALGAVGGFLLRSWWSLIVVPAAYVMTLWTTRELTCPECHGLTYDVGLLGALVYGLVGLSPMIAGAIIGTWLGQRAEDAYTEQPRWHSPDKA